MNYISHSTQLLTWQHLVNEAMQQSGYQGGESIEHYLVLTLDHFTRDQNLSSVIVAIDFLLALNSLGREGGGKMRRVGDECLLLAGLFPEIAVRRRVSLEYFVDIGREAYYHLTFKHFHWVYDSELFSKLSEDFTCLIAVLQTMRKIHSVPLH